jgi:hypothetical protein
LETSAKNGSNVDTSFMLLAHEGPAESPVTKLPQVDSKPAKAGWCASRTGSKNNKQKQKKQKQKFEQQPPF